MDPNLRMARVISSQYMQMDLRPFNARISSSINQNPFFEYFPGKVVVIPQNTGGHRTYIAFKNGLELIFKFEYIECSEPGAYFHDHIVVAIGAIVTSGARAEEIYSSDMMPPSNLSDNTGQLFDRVILPKQIAEHSVRFVSLLK